MSSQKPANSDAVVAAALFVSSQPLTHEGLCELAGVDEAQLTKSLSNLGPRVAELGLTLVNDASGVMLTVTPDIRKRLKKYFAQHAQPLSGAALEVLTIVAYNQPITKLAIDEARGVSSDASLKTLLTRKLVANQDAKAVEPRYVTTAHFLSTVGISSLGELPKRPGVTRANQ